VLHGQVHRALEPLVAQVKLLRQKRASSSAQERVQAHRTNHGRCSHVLRQAAHRLVHVQVVGGVQQVVVPQAVLLQLRANCGLWWAGVISGGAWN
jgi:hypothetical protein